MVIAILMVIVGAVTIKTLLIAQFSEYRTAAEIEKVASQLPGRRCQDTSEDSVATPIEAASERRGRHDLHVLPECHRQPANVAAGRFRSQNRSQHGPAAYAVALNNWQPVSCAPSVNSYGVISRSRPRLR